MAAADPYLYRMGTCYVLALDNSTAIKREPLPLSCGELLQPGDGLLQLGHNGFSGNPGIVMEAGWSQWFIGTVMYQHPLGVSEMALFKAFNADGVDACSPLALCHPGCELFIAYAWSADNKTYPLCWVTPAMSYRWAKTDYLVRADPVLLAEPARQQLHKVMTNDN